MAGVFVVGATVGLGATWWVNRTPDTYPAGTAIRKFEPVNQAARPARSAGTSGPRGTAGSGRAGAGGINPAELPYDGTQEDVSAKALSLAAIAALAREQSEDSGVAARPGATRTPQAEAAARTSSPSKKNGSEIVAEAADASGGDTSVAQPDVPKKKPAGASYRRRPAASAKDREIERINQQAVEELKKKNTGEQLADSTRARPRYSERKTTADAPSHTASLGNKRLAVARCENAPNLFARERCKWQLCNGMWGKNGCPSYD